ncbi:MAG TPA: class I SAM-dependent methyltransferase [Dongiaceae bacterium]|nr:class I SAM-dependent methyltransferase [Dongiaceae bacterium]
MSFKESLPQARLLVFPLDLDKSREMIAIARSLGLDVIGASSVMPDAEAKKYPIASFHRLPFVTELTFEATFLALLEQEAITHVYIPHGVIWNHLMQSKEAHPDRYSFHLCQPSPYEEDWLRLVPSHTWADQVLAENFVETLHCPNAVRQAPLRHGQLVSLHRQFIGIPGQSDELKLMALAHIARLVPQGDVVEVGSFQGRSAFAIGWLAQHYRIGNLVCVDPWDNDKLVDQGEKARLATQELKRGRDLIDLDKIFRSFISAVGLLGNVGYIRDISEVAIGIYCDAATNGFLPASELDALPLTGNIAMLHIDGNHRYDFVRKDIELWLPHVMPGGWVLLDDYVWAFGDGPKRAGDELLATGQFDVVFTASDTLFLRKGSA